MYVYTHKDTVLLVKFDNLFPECKVLLTPHPHLFQLNCFTKTFCPVNSRCMEKLVPRVRFLFDCFKKVELIIAFFKWEGDVKLRAGIFWNDDRENPRVIRIGPKGWEQLKKSGLDTYEVKIPNEIMGLVGTSKEEPKKEPNELIQISEISKNKDVKKEKE